MRMCYTLALSVAMAAIPASATRLTFDISTTNNSLQIVDNSSVTQNYGDRVAALSVADGGLTFSYGAEGGFTPNVVASYGPASLTANNTVTPCPFSTLDTCVYLYGANFGDLVNVIAQSYDIMGTPPGYGLVTVTLTADPGFLVQLSSFNLAGWLQSNYTVRSVSVFDVVNSTTLFSSASQAVLGAGGTHTTLDTTNFGGVLSARTLQIVIDASNVTGNNGQNVGLDNVVFSQISTAPEPSSVALLGGGLLLGLLRLGRNRRVR